MTKVIKFPENSNIIELMNKAKSKFLSEHSDKDTVFDYEIVEDALKRY